MQLHHEFRTNCTDEADNRSNRKIDVTAGQDTEQHTCRKDEYICIL